MNNWVIIVVLIWLGIISWFDLRTREIPHSAWVIIPLAGAMIFRIFMGGWQLALLAGFIVLVSERQRISSWSGLKPLASVYPWLPLLGLGISFTGQIQPVGTVVLLGFWLAWELRCWGGADAMAAMSLALLWPDENLIWALLAVNALAAIIATAVSLIKEHRFRLHLLPGLPLLFLATVVRVYPFFTGGQI